MKIAELCAVIERETGMPVDAETALDDLGCDSLEFLELLVAIEAASGVHVPFESVAGFKTVGELAGERGLMVAIGTESWKAIDREIEEIAGFHWQELALDQLHFKRDLDHERYLAIDAAGAMHVVTARDGGRLVGYIVCFVMPHFHYKSSGLTALADMYYVLREYRRGGLGARMLMEMERGLKARGVIRAHMSCKVHEDHTRLFEAMGWKLTDLTFSKLLVEG